MKQKILFLSFISIILFGSISQAEAKTIEVKSLSSFSTANPPSTITIQTVSDINTKKGIIPAGLVVTGNLVDVKSPKRLKRDATFSFKPISYIDVDGNNHNINSDIKGKYTTLLNKGQIAESAAKSVGNFFIKGFSMGISAVEGAVKNKEDNRLKSSAVSVYEASPVSYVEKGQEINIEKSEVFYLKFPDYKDDNN